MSDQYYRVKVEWPLPYFLSDQLDAVGTSTSVFDSRFYTRATNLRDVYIDIQAHLVKCYSEKGLNEHELDEISPDIPASEVLQMYSRTGRPVQFEVEVINDPEHVDLISRAIEQHAFIKAVSNSIAIGLIPIKGSWTKTLSTLGCHEHNLDRAIANVLHVWYAEAGLDTLREIVGEGDVIVRELQTHAKSVIQNNKDT